MVLGLMRYHFRCPFATSPSTHHPPNDQDPDHKEILNDASAASSCVEAPSAKGLAGGGGNGHG